MTFHYNRPRLTLFPLFVLVVLSVAGCGDLQQGPEDRDPTIRRARERRAAGDYNGAIEQYRKALDKKPGLARIHWEMGSVYDQHLTNDIRAIYHYERYLELEPDADRNKLVHDLIGAARMSYAASLPARPSEAVQEIARLNKELEALRSLLEESREERIRLDAELRAAQAGVSVKSAGGTIPAAPATTLARPPAVVAPPAPAPRPAPAQTATLETYVVKPGDTLSRIASRVYGDANQWQVIYDANRAILNKPESVRVGQSLMIPR